MIDRVSYAPPGDQPSASATTHACRRLGIASRTPISGAAPSTDVNRPLVLAAIETAPTVAKRPDGSRKLEPFIDPGSDGSHVRACRGSQPHSSEHAARFVHSARCTLAVNGVRAEILAECPEATPEAGDSSYCVAGRVGRPDCSTYEAGKSGWPASVAPWPCGVALSCSLRGLPCGLLGRCCAL